MSKADITIEIEFDLDEPDKTIIKTNARKEAIAEILENWLFDQIGEGKDTAESNNKPRYKIKIQLDLSSDTFFTSSDTGNHCLTCGIIMDVIKRIESIAVYSL